MTSYRKQRVADLLLSFVAEELRRMSDPRLELVTITDLEVTRDLKVAKVFWSLPKKPQQTSESSTTLLPSDKERAEVEKGLTKAAVYLRRRVGEELDLRHVPELVFVYDQSAAHGSRIEELLATLKP